MTEAASPTAAPLLRMAGIAKLKAGMTSIEEVVGNTAPDTTR